MQSGVPVVAAESELGLHVAVFWDAKNAAIARQVGRRAVKTDDEFATILSDVLRDYQRLNESEAAISIDAAGEVPWKNLAQVVASCRNAGWKRIELLVP